MIRTTLRPEGLVIASRAIRTADFPTIHPTCLNRDNHRPAGLSLLRHPFVQTHKERFRNFNLIPITYAFPPRLRGRLTLSGLALLRKP